MRLLLKSYKLTNFFQKKVLGKSFLYCLFHIFSIAETVFKSRSKAKSNISIITQIYNHYHILYGLRTLSEFFLGAKKQNIIYYTMRDVQGLIGLQIHKNKDEYKILTWCKFEC